MLRFRSLASSSAGNATLVEADDGRHRTRLLVDCGLGWRQLHQRLAQAGVTPEQLDGVFITHEHGDHVGCVAQLSARYGVPVWASAGTLQALQKSRALPLAQRISDGSTVAVGGLQIRPFTVPHDAREPLQLTCTDGDRSLGITTDLGHATPYLLQQLSHCNALILESNHDPQLLARSRYPDFLKRRISGMLGHLNNAQAVDILRAVGHAGLGIVMAAHLSESNNDPQQVRQMFSQALGRSLDEVMVSGRNGLDWLPV